MSGLYSGNGVTIEESGMTFGPFSEEQFFYVENSNIYNK